jgi:glycosyltransferase involved in cell wall biosynthesis
VPARCAFLITSLPGGGAERILLGHLRLLRGAIEPVLILAQAEGELLELVPPWLELHVLPQYREGSWVAHSGRRVLALSELLRRLRPAALVSHLPYCDYLHLQARCSSRQAWTSLCWLHGPAETSGTGTEKWLLRRLYRSADRLIAVSRGVAKTHQSTYGLRCEVEHNLHDLDDIRRLSRQPLPGPGWSGEGVRLLAVGRLEPCKGMDILLRALHGLRELDWHLVVVGQGEQAAELSRLAAELGLSQRVTWGGWYPNPLPYFAAGELLVSPSRWEGLPGVLIEAMAVGIPILASDSPGGSAEAVGEGRHGRLFPSENSSALAEALRELVQRRELLAELGERSRTGAERFDEAVGREGFVERFLGWAGVV